jgi:hypothetical protein
VPHDTATVTTGRPEGGEHRYFTVPARWDGAPLRIGNHALAADLDVRHIAGYVLAPPSVHPSGARYRWRTHAGGPLFAPLPLALLARLVAPPDARQPAALGVTGRTPVRGDVVHPAPLADDAERWRRVRAYVAKVDAGLADARRRTAFRLAAALVHDFQLGHADVWGIVTAWDHDNRPPLGDALLARIVANATTYGGTRRRWAA